MSNTLRERHLKVVEQFQHEEKRDEMADKKSASMDDDESDLLVFDDVADEEDYRFALSPLALMKYLGDRMPLTDNTMAGSKEEKDSNGVEKLSDKEEVILLEEKL